MVFDCPKGFPDANQAVLWLPEKYSRLEDESKVCYLNDIWLFFVVTSTLRVLKVYTMNLLLIVHIVS